MLVSIKEMLGRAKAEGYGVPAVSAGNEVTLRAAIEEAEKASSPIIILVGYYFTDAVNYYCRLIEDFAKAASVPVTAMWDHSGNFKQSVRGIRSGWRKGWSRHSLMNATALTRIRSSAGC